MAFDNCNFTFSARDAGSSTTDYSVVPKKQFKRFLPIIDNYDAVKTHFYRSDLSEMYLAWFLDGPVTW